MTTLVVDRLAATHIHGPGLVSWLEEQGVCEPDSSPAFLDHKHRSSIGNWRKGSDAKVTTADVVLTALDIRLEELPDQLFLEKQDNNAALPVEKQERIVSLRRLDWSLTEIAAMVGVNKDTVSRYVRKAGLVS